MSYTKKYLIEQMEQLANDFSQLTTPTINQSKNHQQQQKQPELLILKYHEKSTDNKQLTVKTN